MAAAVEDQDAGVQKEMFEMVTKNDIAGLQLLLSSVKQADVHDENGMTPLQHAAYKGHKEMVQLLLDQGADVNSSRHEHKYTALHFAALSGNTEICRQLLMAGAWTGALNSVSRTPAQMAAFVGNYECVAIINNFVPKVAVEYYYERTDPPPLDFLAIEPLHRFIIDVNINPIRVFINLKGSTHLLNNLQPVIQVLQSLSKGVMHGFSQPVLWASVAAPNQMSDDNQMLAFKFHYLGYILNELHTNCKTSGGQKTLTDVCELFIRKLLRGTTSSSNSSNECMDNLIKDCVREFRYRESTIFKQLIASLSTSDENHTMSPLSILCCIVAGEQYTFSLNGQCCDTCQQPRPTKKCSKCRLVQYCDRECQRLHWFLHKKVCMRSTTTSSSSSSRTSKQQVNNGGGRVEGVEAVDTSEITNEIHNLLLNK